MRDGEFDEAAVEAEIRAAFDAYEAALGANDVTALTGFFWQSPRAVRMMTDGGLYGIDEIAAFRKGRDVSDLARDLTRVDIVALAPDVGVATAEYRRKGSGRRGAQTQVWVRRPEGWRIASAHVSLGGCRLNGAGHAATSAITLRQSPKAVTSSAPTTPAGSQRNPFGAVPSASVDRADRERRRHAGNEAPERRRRQRPDLDARSRRLRAREPAPAAAAVRRQGCRAGTRASVAHRAQEPPAEPRPARR